MVRSCHCPRCRSSWSFCETGAVRSPLQVSGSYKHELPSELASVRDLSTLRLGMKSCCQAPSNSLSQLVPSCAVLLPHAATTLNSQMTHPQGLVCVVYRPWEGRASSAVVIPTLEWLAPSLQQDKPHGRSLRANSLPSATSFTGKQLSGYTLPLTPSSAAWPSCQQATEMHVSYPP